MPLACCGLCVAVLVVLFLVGWCVFGVVGYLLLHCVSRLLRMLVVC